MKIPQITDATRLQKLTQKPEKVRIVLDTDTYNEIDDQFAVVYSLLSPEKIDVEAIYAAPFFNSRSSGPGDGMELVESLENVEALIIDTDGKIFKSSGLLEYIE